MAEGVLTFELCAPGQDPIDMQVSQLVVPGTAGIFTVLPGHTAVLSTLTHGAIIANTVDGEKRFFAVHGGFADVLNDSVHLLAEGIEESTSVDEARAKAALERAEKRLKKREEDLDVPRAEAALARSRARLQAHGHTEY